ncbi:hypothetical protein AB2B41_03070 [Marimonas sp. MJW-29]|uniref:Uncharacterized protein n=1 Tax=Sulfitobacter sediminis TaxID=3234186 RepID=A0ABV3RI35_9RHOB
MIARLLRRSVRRFAARHDYDASYMLHVVDTSTSAGVRLAALPFFTQFTGPRGSGGVWAGAVLASTLEGDCGPCVQLVLDMAIEKGVPADLLALCIEGRAKEAGEVGLGFRFAEAAIADAPELDTLRAEIEARHGAEAVVAASFASAGGRIYPVMKRGLGFGKSCRRLRIGEREIGVVRQA